jgi:hypothetical protein
MSMNNNDCKSHDKTPLNIVLTLNDELEMRLPWRKPVITRLEIQNTLTNTSNIENIGGTGIG